jgi:hypothetical protein
VQASEVEEGIEPREPAGDVQPAVADEVRFAFFLSFISPGCLLLCRSQRLRKGQYPSRILTSKWGPFLAMYPRRCVQFLFTLACGPLWFCMQESGLETEEAADGIESQAYV